MPKRYHSSSKVDHHKDHFNDEHHSAKSGKMANSGFHKQAFAEHYAGMEPRRRRELEDGGMIHENHSAVANLPQEVMIKPYPKTGPYLPEGLDDTLRGVDKQMDYDDSQRSRHFYPKKV